MTLDIIILGGGCANCERLMQHSKEAVAQLGVEATFSKSGDHEVYAKYGLLATPGLVVNDRLLAAGRVPTADQIVTLLTHEMTASRG